MKGGKLTKERTGDIFRAVMNVELKERSHCPERVKEGSICDLSAFHYEPFGVFILQKCSNLYLSFLRPFPRLLLLTECGLVH